MKGRGLWSELTYKGHRSQNTGKHRNNKHKSNIERENELYGGKRLRSNKEKTTERNKEQIVRKEKERSNKERI